MLGCRGASPRRCDLGDVRAVGGRNASGSHTRFSAFAPPGRYPRRVTVAYRVLDREEAGVNSHRPARVPPTGSGRSRRRARVNARTARCPPCKRRKKPRGGARAVLPPRHHQRDRPAPGQGRGRGGRGQIAVNVAARFGQCAAVTAGLPCGSIRRPRGGVDDHPAPSARLRPAPPTGSAPKPPGDHHAHADASPSLSPTPRSARQTPTTPAATSLQ